MIMVRVDLMLIELRRDLDLPLFPVGRLQRPELRCPLAHALQNAWEDLARGAEQEQLATENKGEANK